MHEQADIRITSEIWVAAYRAKLEKQGIPIFVNKAGDKTAGSILVKVSKMDSFATLYHRILDTSGQRYWEVFESDTEEHINQVVKKQCLFDPDLWILEIEDPKGRHFLQEFNF